MERDKGWKQVIGGEKVVKRKSESAGREKVFEDK
jgi:hypothetical protein